MTWFSSPLYSPVLLSWIIFKYCNNDSRSSQNPWEYWILILSRTKRWVWWEQGKNEGDVRLLLFSQLGPKNLWNRICTIFKGVCVYKLRAVFVVIDEIKKNCLCFFNFHESWQKQDSFYKQWNLYQTTFFRERTRSSWPQVGIILADFCGFQIFPKGPSFEIRKIRY